MFTEELPEFNVTDKRREVWKIELEMLDLIDEICRKNNISYFLFAGCAIGAVRHKGFIPWDEDIDIGMYRDDFEKFLCVCKKEFEGKYAVQYGWNGQFDYPDTFFRLRDYRSTAILEWETDKNNVKGIFVEIYVFDKVPNNKWHRKIHLRWCTLLWHIVNGSIEKGEYKGLKKILHKGLRIIDSKATWAYWKKECTKYNQNTNLKYVNLVSIPRWARDEDNLYYYDDIKKSKDVMFENKIYMIPEGVGRCLTISYGDYMKYPTIETINKTKTRNTFYDPYLPYTHYERTDIVKEYFDRRAGDCLD